LVVGVLAGRLFPTVPADPKEIEPARQAALKSALLERRLSAAREMLPSSPI